MKDITESLFSLKDEKYKKFSSSLVPAVDPRKIIGVRMPDIRALAKTLDAAAAERFMSELPHEYHEENLLHAALTEREKNFEKCIEKTQAFLPFIDNWAVCDCFNPAVFGKNREKLLIRIKEWIQSGRVYTARFGIKMLMTYFLDDGFLPCCLDLPLAADTGEYYLSMMTAWFFATALGKQYESALAYIEQRRLDPSTHNRAIQKAVESRRITPDRKEYLKTLRIKEKSNA